MAKQEREVERWITVNGARVPIFKDGSIGGPKALRDKVQKKIDNDPANKGVTRKDVEELTAKKDKLKGTKLKTKPISNEEVKAMKENNVFAKKAPEHITDAKSVNELHDKLKSQGLSMESADADDIKRDYRSMNGEKVSLYDKDGNEYRGTFNRYSDGSTEIVNIKKEWYNRTPEDAHSANIKNKKAKQIDKDNDLKEKQIANNKKEADIAKDASGTKTDKAVELAKKKLDFNRPGEYAEISNNHWSYVNISNDKMADLMSKSDNKYEYEHVVEKDGNTIHHRLYRVPKEGNKTSFKKSTARKEQLEIQIDDMYSKYANKFSVDPNNWLMYGEEGKKAYYAYKNAVAEFEPDAKKRKKYFKDRRTF